MSPTARSLQVLRQLGYEADVVERWVGRQRKDLFGCIDIVAVHPTFGILGVQATTTSNMAARVKKIEQEPRVGPWIEHAKLEVWGWAKRGKQGERKLWTLRRVRV